MPAARARAGIGGGLDLAGGPARVRGLGSTHGLDLTMALEMADVLGRLPPSVLLFAVEAGACGPVADLSPDLGPPCRVLDRRLREVVEGRRRLEQRSS